MILSRYSGDAVPRGILLFDGNPLDDVSILGDNGKNIPLIMKDGRVYKNTLK